MKIYSKSQTIIANMPYTAMMLIGAVTIAMAYDFSSLALVGACAYFVYGIIGALWIMIFVCPYCVYHDTQECPCGYGKISGRIVIKGDRDCFSEKFKRHIPVIVPLWFIPLVPGIYNLIRTFSWPMLVLITLFAIEKIDVNGKKTLVIRDVGDPFGSYVRAEGEYPTIPLLK